MPCRKDFYCESKQCDVNYRIIKLTLIVSLFIFRVSVFAQENRTNSLTRNDIESLLPPLSALIDSAIAHNPGIKSTDLQVKVKQYKLNADKVVWTKNLGLQTDIRYGTFNNFSTNAADGQSPSTLSTLNSQLNYGVGAFVKLPIYEALSRKDQLRSDLIEIQQTQNLSLAQRDDMRQLVIKQYNDLILKHRIFVIKSKYAETIKINMQLAEKEFQNGILNLDSYSRVCDTYARSEAEFESVKMDLRTAFMTLEIVVGMKLNYFQ